MLRTLARIVLAAILIPACVPPQGSYGHGQTGYAQAGYAQPAYGQPADGQSAYGQPGSAPAAERQVRFNGRALDAQGQAALAQIEAQYGQRLPDGDYWYDPRSGAAGAWGGPAAAVLPAGLALGGPLPAGASGGGDGRLTGVFVNGRELHPQDVAALRTFTAVQAGRYWVDGQGNGGYEGGPAMFNLYALARQAQQRSGHGGQGGGSYWTQTGNGSITVGGGGFNSNWKSDGGTVDHSCSYDPNDGAGVMCN